MLEGQIAAAQVWVNEEEQVVMVKFSRADVQEILEAGEVELIVSGELFDGTKFEGTDTIRVIVLQRDLLKNHAEILSTKS